MSVGAVVSVGAAAVLIGWMASVDLGITAPVVLATLLAGIVSASGCPTCCADRFAVSAAWLQPIDTVSTSTKDNSRAKQMPDTTVVILKSGMVQHTAKTRSLLNSYQT